MSEDTRAYEKKRYRRDKKKRIAAERAYEASHPETKEKKRARRKAQAQRESGNTPTLPSTRAKCPNCGKTGGRKEWHHTSYKTGSGEVRCSRCNPRGGAA